MHGVLQASVLSILKRTAVNPKVLFAGPVRDLHGPGLLLPPRQRTPGGMGQGVCSISSATKNGSVEEACLATQPLKLIDPPNRP